MTVYTWHLRHGTWHLTCDMHVKWWEVKFFFIHSLGFFLLLSYYNKPKQLVTIHCSIVNMIKLPPSSSSLLPLYSPLDPGPLLLLPSLLLQQEVTIQQSLAVWNCTVSIVLGVCKIFQIFLRSRRPTWLNGKKVFCFFQFSDIIWQTLNT